MSAPVGDAPQVDPNTGETIHNVETPVNEGPLVGADYQTMIGALPKGIGDHPEIAKHETFESAMKEYANLTSVVGRKGVLMPKANDPEDSSRFWSEVGRPKEAADYRLPDGTTIPEDLPWDDDFAMGMVKAMHDAGITQDQFQKFMPNYINGQAAMMEGAQAQMTAQSKAATDGLRQELGMTYDEKINLAERAMTKLFGQEADSFLNSRMADGTALGNHVPFIKAIIQIGEMFGEDSMSTDHTNRMPGSMTPDEAVAEKARLFADPEFSEQYFNPAHIGHAAAQARMDQIYAYAQGKGAITNASIGKMKTYG